ncbi:MAG: metallophosphoesterase [Lunatimonas sp.]|uniref:metallophosphoesterase n=1 Tax=Lunatimonas sp. TaxID=2060141 RepID=UPI00263B9E97|nr:metallophosphoesterase [Lunatimonas sp.]MCC5935813.1 metallophosphoesterase [Lunatimonas sp.]
MKSSLLSLLVGIALYLSSCMPSEQGSFEFMVIGDVPYHLPEDFSRFEQMVQAINDYGPAFTIHVGDIKSGSTPCTDEYFEQIRGYFSDFEQPLMYTPGDNEWTDCHRPACGEYDPEERLDKLRQLFFSDGKSQGKNPQPLHTQNTYEGFEKFVENAMWDKDRISFATIHVVGSNNNLKLDSLALNDEFYEREMASLFWLNRVFDSAIEQNHSGIVLAIHAGLNYPSQEDTNGHLSFVNLLRERVSTFEKPVLLLYGDFHKFMVDKPLVDAQRKVITNFTQVQTFGDRDMHAVRIRVNPANPNLFEIHQHFVDGN